MSIAPRVNDDQTPQVRRPRLTVSEGVAISGPFDLVLYCTEAGKYRPGPNDITVTSERVAITATTEQPAVDSPAWGSDYPVAGAIGPAGSLVGHLWIKSVDTDEDGLDDLEVDGSVTLSGCFGLIGSGLLDMDGALAGIGSLGLSGSAALGSVNPLAGIGDVVFAGAGVIGVIGMLAGTGNMSFSGQGTLGLILSTFTDNFDGSTLDARWTAVKTAAPTITVAGGELLLANNTAVDTDAAFIYLNNPVQRETATYTIKAKEVAGGAGDCNPMFIWQGSAPPTHSTATTWNAGLRAGWSMVGGFSSFIYRTPAAAFYNWMFGVNTGWTTGGGSPYEGTLGTYYRCVLETTATQFRMTLRSADGSSTLGTYPTTGWVNWTTVCPNTDPMYLVIGDPYTNAYRRNMTLDLVSKA